MTATSTPAATPAQALVFNNTEFSIIDQGGTPWLRANQIAAALGYSGEKAIHVIYSRHADEFTEAMTGVINLKTPQGEQSVRIFSMRGAHLIAMFSRVPVAKEFRKWVLDILERETQAPQRTPYSVHPTQTLTAEEADTLRLMLGTAVQQLPKDQQAQAAIQGWAKLKSHFKVSYRQIPRGEYPEALNLMARHVAQLQNKEPQQALAFDPTDATQMQNIRAAALEYFDKAHAAVKNGTAWPDTENLDNILRGLLANAITSQQWAVAFDHKWQMSLHPVPQNTLGDLARRIAGGEMLATSEELLQLGQACRNRLMQKLSLPQPGSLK